MDDDLANSTQTTSGRSWLRDRVLPFAVFIGLIWLVFGLQLLCQLFGFDLARFGLHPRTLSGLTGVVTMPFLHGDLRHIVSNTTPLAILLGLLVVSRRRPLSIMVVLTVVTGIALWIVGRPDIHIGASGLVYALMGFLLVAGFMERRLVSMVVSLFVGVTYGAAIFGGLLPSEGVSWEGHLCGLLAGAALAWSRFGAVDRESK